MAKIAQPGEVPPVSRSSMRCIDVSHGVGDIIAQLFAIAIALAVVDVHIEW
jgi:hypothetical protein